MLAAIQNVKIRLEMQVGKRLNWTDNTAFGRQWEFYGSDQDNVHVHPEILRNRCIQLCNMEDKGCKSVPVLGCMALLQTFSNIAV